jgi:CRISPR-associated protein Cas2
MLVVFLTENVSASVRGDLARWMLEPRAGVFVGDLPASVRDALWERLRRNAKVGACTMIRSADVDQRVEIDVFRDPRRRVGHFEGFTLVRVR